VDPVSDLENALGAELLRASMLRRHPPWIAGRYCVEKFLGRGAMGLVVAATDERLGRPVALKLRPSGLDTTMLAEARALARLDHPNVVRVHDVDIVESRLDGKQFRLWMVSMQRVTGRTLRTWLAEKTRSTDEIIDVFLAAGRGVEAAHAEKIVHRDFKPDNVLIRTDGIAQVIDFGFAVPAVATRDDGKRFPFEIAGTDAYMAPEARKGRPTAKSDQFAFAIALAEALTGKADRPGFFTPTGVPRATWKVLRRATRPSSRRYPTMHELLGELDASRRPSRTWSRLRRGALATMVLLAGAYAITQRPQIFREAAVVAEAALHWVNQPSASDRGGDATWSRPPTPPPNSSPPQALPVAVVRAEPATSSAPADTVEPSPVEPTSLPVPTRQACPFSGEYDLQSESSGLFGCYRFTFHPGEECSATVEKYASRRDCDRPTSGLVDNDVRVSLDGAGALAVAEFSDRRCVFHIDDVAAGLAGTLEIHGDGGVTYASTTDLSRSAGLAGHDTGGTDDTDP